MPQTATMTPAQEAKLRRMCIAYEVPFRSGDYMIYDADSWMMPGWVEGWIGGRDFARKTIYVGVSPEGEAHS